MMNEPELAATLIEIGRLLASREDPREALPAILDRALALVRGERGFIIVLDATRQYRIAAARNLDEEEIRDAEFKVSRTIVERVARTGKSELVADAGAEIETRDITSVRTLELRSIACVPMRAHGETVGVLYVDNRHVTGRFGERDRSALEALAVPAAISLAATRRTIELVRSRDDLARQLAIVERLRADAQEQYRGRARAVRRELDRAPPGEESSLPGVVARSRAMRAVLDLARRAAPSGVNVLIAGESGTGKEVVARAIHSLSGRPGPFLAESCAALAETLLESELFGHEAGSFTGAVSERLGLFETARGGTLFLDEVGEMSPGLQAKLLRVIQERAIRRVGGSRAIPIDVRLIAATHRDLTAMVAQGTFRADLLYRLDVVRIEIPPLRARREDLPAFLDHFLEQARARGPIELEPPAREALLAYSWPGNVRELENEITRLSVLSETGRIGPGQLSRRILDGPAPAAPPPSGDDAGLAGVWNLDALEKEMLVRALRFTGNNKALAARLLGLAKSSIYHRLRKHGLDAEGE